MGQPPGTRPGIPPGPGRDHALRSAEALPGLDFVADAVRAPCLVMLDFDGVIAPITPLPEDARPDPSVVRAMRRLATITPVHVVTGRDSTWVRSHLGAGAQVWGNHGLDLLPPHETIRWRPVLARARRTLQGTLPSVPGLLLEDKPFSLAVHYRQVPDMERRVQTAVAQAAKEAEGAGLRLRVLAGSMVQELRPDLPFDKGTVVARLRTQNPDHQGIYLGDDVTDEDAFRRLPHPHIPVLVADEDRPTAARARIPRPYVARLLDEVADRTGAA